MFIIYPLVSGLLIVKTFATCDETFSSTNSEDYRGCLAVSTSGSACRPWDDQNTLHPGVVDLFRADNGLSTPYDGIDSSHNYCRNPDGSATIWCYLAEFVDSGTGPRFEDCDPDMRCIETYSGLGGADYRGCLATTKSGHSCRPWDEQNALKPSNVDGYRDSEGLSTPYDGIDASHNYCRNPDNEATIWCYLEDPPASGPAWEYCDPDTICDSTFSGVGGENYRGCLSTTESGARCRPWDEQNLLKPSNVDGYRDSVGLSTPYDGISASHNYCRNPDNEATIWCYLDDPPEDGPAWEYCSIDGLCDETLTGTKGEGYRGCMSRTESGAKCRPWDEQNTLNPSNVNLYRETLGLSTPYDGIDASHNYCRNPDNEARIWCYLADPPDADTTWEYCSTDGMCDETYAGVNGEDYRGCISTTRLGATCRPWDEQNLLKPSNVDGYRESVGLSTPYDGIDASHNYCRNPDNEATIWCYLEDPPEGGPAWDYCSTSGMCDETMSGVNGDGYRGCMSTTVSGAACRPWDESNTLKPSNVDGYRESVGLSTPYDGIDASHNYCRNPDNEATIWCYLEDPPEDGPAWEYCIQDGPCVETVWGANGENYRGCRNTSVSGAACRPWDEQNTLKPSNVDAFRSNSGLSVPYDGINATHNYCRNPDGEVTLWCYLAEYVDSGTGPAWEYCLQQEGICLADWKDDNQAAITIIANLTGTNVTDCCEAAANGMCDSVMEECAVACGDCEYNIPQRECGPDVTDDNAAIRISAQASGFTVQDCADAKAQMMCTNDDTKCFTKRDCPVTCKQCTKKDCPASGDNDEGVRHYLESLDGDIIGLEFMDCCRAVENGLCSDSAIADLCPVACEHCSYDASDRYCDYTVFDSDADLVNAAATRTQSASTCVEAFLKGMCNLCWVKKACPVSCEMCTNLPSCDSIEEPKDDNQAMIDFAKSGWNLDITGCDQVLAEGNCLVGVPEILEFCPVTCNIDNNQAVVLFANTLDLEIEGCSTLFEEGKCDVDPQFKVLCPQTCIFDDNEGAIAFAQSHGATIAGCITFLEDDNCELLPQIVELCPVTCKPQQPCTDACDETLSGEGDMDYRGCKAVTISGHTCQEWTAQAPHPHSRTPENYPSAGLGPHNFCRNPDGEPTIWCYTMEHNVRWDFCENPSNVCGKPFCENAVEDDDALVAFALANGVPATGCGYALEVGDCARYASVRALCPLTCPNSCREGKRPCAEREVDDDVALANYLTGLGSSALTCAEAVDAGYCANADVQESCPLACESCDPDRPNLLPEFEDLDGQTTLICNNDFTGSIPASWSQITDVEKIFIQFNDHLTGTIPPLPNANKLKDLVVITNPKLTGPIPEVNHMTALTTLRFEENSLTGPLPQMDKLTALISARFWGNGGLNGQLPNLQSLTNLTDISFSRNQFTGNFPNVQGLSHLQEIWLSDNLLTGNIPDLSSLTALATLAIKNNSLTGSLESIRDHEMELIYVSDNKIEDDISVLSQFTSLRVFAGSNCGFKGSLNDIPFRDMPDLEAWYSSRNKLTGSIPPRREDVAKLNALVLHHNFLSGTLPSYIYELQYFTVFSNAIQGSLPTMYWDVDPKLFLVHDNRMTCELTYGNPPFGKTNKDDLPFNNSMVVMQNNFYTDTEREHYYINDVELRDELMSKDSAGEWRIYLWLCLAFGSIFAFFVFWHEDILDDNNVALMHHVKILKFFGSNRMFNRWSFAMVTLFYGSLWTFYGLTNYYHGKSCTSCGTWLDNYSLTNFASHENWEAFLVIWFFIHNMVCIVLISHLRESSKLHILEDIRKAEKKRNWLEFAFAFVALCAVCFLQFCLIRVYTMFHFVPQEQIIKDTDDRITDFFVSELSVITENTTLVALSISLVGSFLFPFFTRMIFVTTTWIAFVLAFLRVVFMYVLPIVFTIYYSSSCLGRWVPVWEPCEESDKYFNVVQDQFPYENILRGEEICGQTSSYDFFTDPTNYTDCGRSVLSLVGWLLFEKMIISVVIMPLIVAFLSFTKLQLRNWTDNHPNPNWFITQVPNFISRSVRFDSEFATLITYVDTLVLWGFMIPPLVPLCYFATTNHAVVLWWQKQIKMTFYPANYEAAMYILYLSFLFNQVLVLIFWSASGENDGLNRDTLWAILSLCVLTWIYIGWSFFHERSQYKKSGAKRDSYHPEVELYSPGIGMNFNSTTVEELYNAQMDMSITDDSDIDRRNIAKLANDVRRWDSPPGRQSRSLTGGTDFLGEDEITDVASNLKRTLEAKRSDRESDLALETETGPKVSSEYCFEGRWYHKGTLKADVFDNVIHWDTKSWCRITGRYKNQISIVIRDDDFFATMEADSLRWSDGQIWKRSGEPVPKYLYSDTHPVRNTDTSIPSYMMEGD